MRLSKISATNLKGKSFEYDLAAITIFVGPNGTGKTAIREAIQLATNKYCPDLGKEPSATFQLSSSEQMTVKATAESDGVLYHSTQSWQDKAPKYSGTPLVNNPPEMADIGVFFSMTGPQRASYVFSLVDPKEYGFDEKNIVRAVASISVESERAEKIKAELVEEVKLHIHEAAGESAQKWMTTLVADISERDKNAAADLRGMLNAQTAKAKRTDGDLFSESIPDDVTERLATARETLAEMEAKRIANAEEYKRIEKELAKIESSKITQPIVIPAGDPEAIQAEIDKLTKERAAIVLDDEVSVKSFRAGDAVESCIDELAKLDIECNKARKDLASIKTKCHECGHPLSKVGIAKQKKAINATLAAAIKAIEAKSRELKKLETASIEASASEKANSEREAKHAELSELISEFQLQHNAILSARAKLKATTPNIENEPSLRQQLEECRKQASQFSGPLDEMKTTVAKLEGQERAKIERQQDAKRDQEASEARWDAQAKSDVFKAAKRALLKEYDAFNAGVWETLTKKARRLTDGMFDPPLTLAFKDGGLGYWGADGRWIGVEMFSGAQRFLAHVGLQIALTERAPLRIITADELSGPLDDLRCEMFILKMADMIADGTIHQVVCFDWNLERYRKLAIRSLNIIEVK